MLAGRGIENEDRTFQAAKLIGAEIAGWDVAAAEVDEERFPAVMEASVRKDVTDIVERQVPLRQPPPGVLRNNGHSRFSHLPSPPSWSGPTKRLAVPAWVLLDLLFSHLGVRTLSANLVTLSSPLRSVLLAV